MHANSPEILQRDRVIDLEELLRELLELTDKQSFKDAIGTDNWSAWSSATADYAKKEKWTGLLALLTAGLLIMLGSAFLNGSVAPTFVYWIVCIGLVPWVFVRSAPEEPLRFQHAQADVSDLANELDLHRQRASRLIRVLDTIKSTSTKFYASRNSPRGTTKQEFDGRYFQTKYAIFLALGPEGEAVRKEFAIWHGFHKKIEIDLASAPDLHAEFLVHRLCSLKLRRRELSLDDIDVLDRFFQRPKFMNKITSSALHTLRIALELGPKFAKKDALIVAIAKRLTDENAALDKSVRRSHSEAYVRTVIEDGTANNKEPFIEQLRLAKSKLNY
ncbi:MAG TPA: hypothetical protein DIU09_03885 [Hyphomonadaceae bacterium]|nr:hypothetical protein AEM38_09815 [Hyphomonadaceae bacterium UKL13-1]HCP63713.1 hypothetical protein [Hyphomonadaceae bacterium]